MCIHVYYSPFFFSLQHRALFPKIDIDKDNKVSMTELYEWIEQHMRKHVLRGADLKMRDIDTDKDGKVSWEEYKASEFPPSFEEGKKVVAWFTASNCKKDCCSEKLQRNRRFSRGLTVNLQMIKKKITVNCQKSNILPSVVK